MRQLAEECAKLGATQLTAASLANIERGQDPGAKRRRREVTAEELVILAFALRVPPVLLMVPMGDENEMTLVPGVVVHPYDAALWISGRWDQDKTWGPVSGLDHQGHGIHEPRLARLPESVDFALLPGAIYSEIGKLLSMAQRMRPYIPSLSALSQEEIDEILGDHGHIEDEVKARTYSNTAAYVRDLTRLADYLMRGEAAGIRLPRLQRRIYEDLQWVAANIRSSRSRPYADVDEPAELLPVSLPKGLEAWDYPEEGK